MAQEDSALRQSEKEASPIAITTPGAVGGANQQTDALPSLRALLRIALYYGVAGFGGGYSVLAQLRRDLVERRRWLSSHEFLVFAELSKSLPGTPATSLIALLGQRLAGARGGVLAAIAFLLPSMAMMIACGAAYSLIRAASGLTLFFDGMSAAMVGVVAAVTFELARSALRTRISKIAAVVCGLLLALRVLSEPMLAGGAVALGAILAGTGIDRRFAAERASDAPPPSIHPAFFPFALKLAAGASALGLLAGLVRVFVPIGVMTFGGGLAMIPAIEHTVVVDQGWLDPRAFANAIALGQITPGPVAICATFIGYRVAGLLGAIVATMAMFGPAIGLALLAGHSVDRFRRSPLVQGALRALAPAVIGMLLAATIGLGRASIEDGVGGVVAVASFAVLARSRLSPLWPLMAGGLVHVAWNAIAHHG